MLRAVPSILALVAAWTLGGCDRVGLGPQRADSAPPESPATAPAQNLRPFAGTTYQDFAARPEFARYAASGLGLSDRDQARLMAAMAAPAPAWVAHGGGAEALLFTGCGTDGCAAAQGVVAIDLATGAAFAGVRDSEGETDLIPNARLEALLRLSSPDRAWISPAPAPPATP